MMMMMKKINIDFWNQEKEKNQQKKEFNNKKNFSQQNIFETFHFGSTTTTKNVFWNLKKNHLFIRL